MENSLPQLVGTEAKGDFSHTHPPQSRKAVFYLSVSVLLCCLLSR